MNGCKYAMEENALFSTTVESSSFQYCIDYFILDCCPVPVRESGTPVHYTTTTFTLVLLCQGRECSIISKATRMKPVLFQKRVNVALLA